MSLTTQEAWLANPAEVFVEHTVALKQGPVATTG